jgi:hypothetical protein
MHNAIESLSAVRQGNGEQHISSNCLVKIRDTEERQNFVIREVIHKLEERLRQHNRGEKLVVGREESIPGAR